MNILTEADLRDYIITAHGMATGNYYQSDKMIRLRIAKLLERAICEDAVMCGFLGRGGPMADRNALGDSGSLETPKSSTHCNKSPLAESVKRLVAAEKKRGVTR